jgi:CxxC motif-containing protein
LKKRIICTVCPQGCEITATFEGDKIVEFTGYGCPRGVEFARTEFTNPLRILSTSVKVEGGCYPLVSVRSDRGIPRSDLMDCMDIIRQVSVKVGTKRGSVVIEHILGSEANVITTADAK